MTKKKVYLLIIIIMGFFFLIGYLFYSENYSNEGILQNVTKRDGYKLHLIKKDVTVEFYIKPKWIPFNSDEKKEFNKEIITENNTTIILDTVWDRGNDIYFNFDTKYKMNYNNGNFMYNGIFNKDGTFTTNGSFTDFYLYNNNGEKVGVGQSGRGPQSSFGFAVEPENYDLIRDGFYVKYSGFNLYEYDKD